jgi:hypothetical protein
LESIGLIRGKGHPSVFWHPKREIRTLVHGDDYVSSGDETSMTWLEAEFAKAYEIRTQKLGMRKEYQQEGKVLNRLVRCTEAGWEIEVDPRHAELVAEQLGIDDKGVSTPGVSGIDEEDTEEDVPLEGEGITRFRGVIARCNYLAADRPDVFSP